MPVADQVEQVDCPMLYVRADVVPDSIDDEERSFEVTWSTGAVVVRRPFFAEPFEEELSLKRGHVRLDQLNSGRAPFLDAHNRFGLSGVLGVIEAGSARVAGEHDARAKVRLSQREGLADVWQDIRGGILTNVSAGYQVHRFEDVTERGAKMRRLRAVDWTPREISLVPIGADVGAAIRSDGEPTACEIVHQETNRAMPEPTQPAAGEPTNEPTADPAVTTRAAGEPAPAPAATSQPEPDPEPVDQDAIRQEGAVAERARITGIRSAAGQLGLPESAAEELVESGATLEQANATLINVRAQRDAEEHVHSGIRVTSEHGDAQARGIQNAIEHRIDPSVELSEEGRPYFGMRLLEIGRAYLEERGTRTRGMSPLQLAERTLHSTSDFANLLANVANKTLRAGYDETPRTWLPLSRQVSAADFKDLTRVQLGEAPTLELVPETGEFKRGTIGDAKETYAVKTYGKIIGVTRQTLINDDLDGLSRLPRLYGAAASRLESDTVWALITGNVTMGDGNSLFDAAHSNIIADILAAVADLGAMRLLFRNQKGLDGTTAIQLAMRWLIVPPDLELTAQQLTNNVQPTATGDVNPFATELRGIIVEQRLGTDSAVKWYAAAENSQVDQIEHAYLQGQTGPVIETRNGFDVDGVEFKARHDFGAAVLDWRGLARSTGTS